MGASHLLEHLVFKGTARRSAIDVARTLDALATEGVRFTAFYAASPVCSSTRWKTTAASLWFQ